MEKPKPVGANGWEIPVGEERNLPVTSRNSRAGEKAALPQQRG